MGDTLSPLGIVPFYIRNPFKIHLEQFPSKIEIAQNFIKELPLKFIWNNSHKNRNRLQFFIRNPYKIESDQKINPKILPQIYREIPLQNFYKEKSL